MCFSFCRYETSAYCARATVGDDVDAFFFEFNMIFHGPADAYEAFIRNVVAGIPTAPTFCQMLGFDADNPEVPKRADETGELVKGQPIGIDLAKGVVRIRKGVALFLVLILTEMLISILRFLASTVAEQMVANIWIGKSKFARVELLNAVSQ